MSRQGRAATNGAPPGSPEEGQESAPISPGGVSRLSRYQSAPPADLKGVFVRKYRWGVIDVLDPRHCDFAMMRTAVLSTHLKVG